MVLECVRVNDASDLLKVYEDFCGFLGFCKHLRIGHYLKIHLNLALGLKGAVVTSSARCTLEGSF